MSQQRITGVYEKIERWFSQISPLRAISAKRKSRGPRLTTRERFKMETTMPSFEKVSNTVNNGGGFYGFTGGTVPAGTQLWCGHVSRIGDRVFTLNRSDFPVVVCPACMGEAKKTGWDSHLKEAVHLLQEKELLLPEWQKAVVVLDRIRYGGYKEEDGDYETALNAVEEFATRSVELEILANAQAEIAVLRSQQDTSRRTWVFTPFGRYSIHFERYGCYGVKNDNPQWVVMHAPWGDDHRTYAYDSFVAAWKAAHFYESQLVSSDEERYDYEEAVNATS